MNRMACLRLTQRCADILISVRQEVQDAGGDVGEELKAPIAKLTECVISYVICVCVWVVDVFCFVFLGTRSFDMVYNFLLKQVDRPFLKRYLRRDEILRQIAGCDASLSDSVNTFSVRFFSPFFVVCYLLANVCFLGGPSYRSRSES